MRRDHLSDAAPTLHESRHESLHETVGSTRGRVLVVDGDTAVTTAIQCVLGATYEVVECCDPRDAILGILRGNDYDVILCDLGLPFVAADDFRDQVAAINPGLAERIVFLYSSMDDDGRSGHLAKPLDVEKLKRRVAEFVTLRTAPPRAPFRRLD